MSTARVYRGPWSSALRRANMKLAKWNQANRVKVAAALAASAISLATGCGSVPQKPVLSPLERCVAALGGNAGTGWYVAERIRVADWCAANGHGGDQ